VEEDFFQEDLLFADDPAALADWLARERGWHRERRAKGLARQEEAFRLAQLADNGTEKTGEPLAFQALLFGDESEARAQELAKRAARQRNSEIASLMCQPYRVTAAYKINTITTKRAKDLGCKIGRRAALLKVYRRADQESLILCYWCRRLTTREERHVDHIRPLSQKGEHAAGNLCIACVECNIAKGDMDPEEFRKIVAERRAANSPIAADYFRALARHGRDRSRSRQ
jgi:5-methylcytosine-specific restriction endonuclease McrA